MLASQRIWPSSMLHSLTPSSTTRLRSCWRNSRAASGDGMSGSVTISMSGVPPRLKSTMEYSEPAMRPGVAAGVDELGGVLLHVHAVDAAAELLAVHPVLEPARGGERLVVLADLVRLGEVGIEVVLAVEDVARPHRAVQRQRDARGVLDGAPVDHGQRAGMRQAHRARVDVGLVALGDRAAAEHLGLRVELDVHLEADDGLPAVTSALMTARPPGGSDAARAPASPPPAAESGP